MRKQVRFFSSAELAGMQRKILQQSEAVIGELKAILWEMPSILAIQKLKFERIAPDGIFGERLNLVEYLNQTMTYLVCLHAGNAMMKRHGLEAVIINFGTQPGYDVESTTGDIICECFAATSVKSNEKLRKDVLRLHKYAAAKERYVYYYSHGAAMETAYVEKLADQYKDVSLCGVSFDALISEYP